MGKTCSGKSTIVKELSKYGFHHIITTTTRPMRSKEKQDVDYHFVTEDEFFSKVRHDYFAEYQKYDTRCGTWYYGSVKEDIENAKDNSIIILTPKGYRDVMDRYPKLEYRLIYLYANNQTIKNRLIRRGDKKEEADRRIKKDYEDFRGVENIADRIIYNNDNNDFASVIEKFRNYLEGSK